VAIVLFCSAIVATDAAEDQKALTPADAAKKVNEKVTVELEVKSTGQSANQKLTFLNSETNHRDEKNFTILIDAAAEEKFIKAGILDPKSFYKSKTIRVTGTVTLFQNKPQIKVTEPKQVEVVAKK
jgi:DNA/RNA endonuclease YhcR with UshA esterase domain